MRKLLQNALLLQNAAEQGLFEGVAIKFERSVDVPGLITGQGVKLLLHCKYQVASILYFEVSTEETSGETFINQFKVQIS